MPAVHKNTTYKTLPIKNPFQEGQDAAYSEILQHSVNENKKWRNSTYFHIASLVIIIILFLVAISQQEKIPVLVNVMPSGEAQYLGEVRHGNIQIPDAAIHWWIRKFVSNIRSVSTDYQVVYNNIDDCFFMVTSNYTPIMRDMILKNSPFDLVGKIRRTVEIESVLNVTDRSYQINWSETIIDTSTIQKNYKYRAIVTTQIVNPTDATIKRNPLGIYIENFEMTELK